MQEWGEGRVRCLSPTVLPEEGLLIWATGEVLSWLPSSPGQRGSPNTCSCAFHTRSGHSGRQKLSQTKSTVKNKAESKR